MKKPTLKQTLRALQNYVMFFLVVAFSVTCCMLLFVTTLARTMGIEFTPENVGAAAKLTFGNVVLITLLFTLFDWLRRKLTVDRPVQIITKATEQIMGGDFSVRIPRIHGAGVDGFNRIAVAINRMAEELSGTETLRTDFIANVSHELKTPLAVIGNYAAMLQRPGLTQAQRDEYAKAIDEAARRLAQLITNILKLNKLENQKIFPQTEEFDLTAQLCDALLQFEEELDRKQLQVEAQLEEALPIRSDGELLWLVWSNLISNAIKFTPDGGTIRLQVQAEGEWASVCVEDTGCGMTPEVGRHIFEKFYQGDPSRATRGNGLGLALVKRVVDILGGEIHVQSTPGKGSTFTVRIRRDLT